VSNPDYRPASGRRSGVLVAGFREKGERERDRGQAHSRAPSPAVPLRCRSPSSFSAQNGRTSTEAFARFLTDKTLNASQIEFVNLIVDHLTDHGCHECRTALRIPIHRRHA
jgi:hypothetical protein